MKMTDTLSALPEKVTRLIVEADSKVIGLLSKEANCNFIYTHDGPDVSLTMPHRSSPYTRGALHPVFTQNLPEGYLRRYIAEKLRRYVELTDMYLLALMSDRGVGYLSYDAGLQLPTAEAVSLDDILHWSGKDKLFPQLLEKFYLRGMASGVQPKVAIERSSVLQSEVIVKTYDDEFPLLTVNEFVCMKCAENCGLITPRVWLSDNLEHYVIERFDTDRSGSKLGVEDFATLMGKNGDQKYQGTYENVLKVVENNTHSSHELQKAFELIIFNCLIGNGDAHLKNFSLQYLPEMTSVSLTPVYDITHTLIYETIDNKMALKMRKSKAFPTRHELVEFGYSSGISRSVANDTIERFALKISDCLASLPEASAMPGLRKSIESHVSSTMAPRHVRAVYRHNKKKKYD